MSDICTPIADERMNGILRRDIFVESNLIFPIAFILENLDVASTAWVMTHQGIF